jgi:RNA polymerase sigma-70 factor (ECF subfamily)
LAEDRELWNRVSHGDVEVFDALYRENAPRLQAFLRQLVGNSQTAEDLVQDTFTQVWNRPSGFQPERGSLRGYLFGIARNRASDWWRKQSAAHPLADEEKSACRTEAASIMGDALARLPDEQRTLIWLREVEGLSYAELAENLKIPIGTVRSRIFTAREALRAVWSNVGQGAGGRSV